MKVLVVLVLILAAFTILVQDVSAVSRGGGGRGGRSHSSSLSHTFSHHNNNQRSTDTQKHINKAAHYSKYQVLHRLSKQAQQRGDVVSASAFRQSSDREWKASGRAMDEGHRQQTENLKRAAQKQLHQP